MKGSLVITGGEHRSRRIQAPEGQDTRPTRAMVREALFNMLQGQVAGVPALDLFAGSGALGFEAISRGAEGAVFCDHDKRAMAVIRQNAALLGVTDQCVFLQMDWRQALARLAASGRRFSLIFLDPPYAADLAPVLAEIRARGILQPEGILALEQAGRAGIQLPAGFDITRSRRYGESAVTLINLTAEDRA